MRKITVFNHISLDGYFTDASGNVSFAHNQTPDAEWDAFVSGNASGGGMLLFGRITYQMMASFWPTPIAVQKMPELAECMNSLRKVVFSRTLEKALWNNTTLVKGDLIAEINRLKEEAGEPMVIFGSGSIVSQLAPRGLIDEYQVIVNPVVLGKGRTMFDGVRALLKLTKTRTFKNGNILLCYEPRPNG